MDSNAALSAKLSALMTGLADQKIKNGEEFLYGGGRLFASDVAEIALPCALVLADSLSRHLGMGGSGYEFELGAPNPVFPVHAVAVEPRGFMEVAPFLAEVFESAVFHFRHDLTQVYALAANYMGLVLEDGIEPLTISGVPTVASVMMESHAAIMGSGTFGMSR